MKFFKKEHRLSNATYIACLIICILFGIIYFNKSTGRGLFLNKTGSVILIIISTLLMIFEIVYLCLKEKTKKILLFKNILYFIVLILFFYVIFEWLGLAIINAFKTASALEKRPNNEYNLLIRIAYIWINFNPLILKGIWTTLYLSLLGTIIGLIIGLLFVCIKTMEDNPHDSETKAFFKKVGKGFVNAYVTVFRGTPMMVQAIIIYYFLPGILAGLFKVDQASINAILTVSVSGLITVSLNTTAYLTEVLRGGIESVNKGQLEAARSLGMSRKKSLFYVVLPQAIKNALPSICNEFIVNIKDTSVLSVISVVDLFFVINQINGKYSNQDAIFIAALIYLVLTVGISKILGLIEKKMNLVAKPIPSSN